MKRTMSILFVVYFSSMALGQTVYVARSYMAKPEMATAIERLEGAGFTLCTNRRSAELELRIRYATLREERLGHLGSVRGGYRKRQYSATATLVDLETGILVSNGTSTASYSLDATAPVNIRYQRSSGFGLGRISGRSIRLGGTKSSRDETKERVTGRAISQMIAKYQTKTQRTQRIEEPPVSTEKPAKPRIIYGVVIN